MVDPVTDEMLAEFVVNSHFKSQPKGGKMDDSEPQDGIQGSTGSSDPEVCVSASLKFLCFHILMAILFSYIYTGSFTEPTEEILNILKVVCIPKTE